MRRRRDRGGQRHNRRGEGDGKEKEWKEEKPSGRHEERGSRGSEKRTKQARDSDQRRVISLRWHIRGAQDRRYDVSASPPRSLPPLPSAWLLTAKSVYSYRSTSYNITSWISPLCSAFVAFQHWHICTVFILLIKSWYVHETFFSRIRGNRWPSRVNEAFRVSGKKLDGKPTSNMWISICT